MCTQKLNVGSSYMGHLEYKYVFVYLKQLQMFNMKTYTCTYLYTHQSTCVAV